MKEDMKMKNIYRLNDWKNNIELLVAIKRKSEI